MFVSGDMINSMCGFTILTAPRLDPDRTSAVIRISVSAGKVRKQTKRKVYFAVKTLLTGQVSRRKNDQINYYNSAKLHVVKP